jgi:hypothetical protein
VAKESYLIPNSIPYDYRAYEYCRGGGPQPEENPTRTILGNQAIKQEANAYVNMR